MRDFIKIFLQEKTQINPKRLNKQIKEVIISSCPTGIDKEFLYQRLYLILQAIEQTLRNIKRVNLLYGKSIIIKMPFDF